MTAAPVFTGDDDGSCWVTVGNLSVYIRRTDEGVSVDIHPLGQEIDKPIASAWALFADGPVMCPACQGLEIDVVSVVSEQNGRMYTGSWPLDADGFVWDESGRFDNCSTLDEIAQCRNCQHRGPLYQFYFGV